MIYYVTKKWACGKSWWNKCTPLLYTGFATSIARYHKKCITGKKYHFDQGHSEWLVNCVCTFNDHLPIKCGHSTYNTG